MTPTDNDSGNDNRSSVHLEQRVSHLERLVSVLHERVERLEDGSSSATESNRPVENDTEPDYSELEFIDKVDRDVLMTLDEGAVYRFNTIRTKYRQQASVASSGTAHHLAETLIEETELFERVNGRVRFLGVGKWVKQ
jgi:hypothetical protein